MLSAGHRPTRTGCDPGMHASRLVRPCSRQQLQLGSQLPVKRCTSHLKQHSAAGACSRLTTAQRLQHTHHTGCIIFRGRQQKNVCSYHFDLQGARHTCFSVCRICCPYCLRALAENPGALSCMMSSMVEGRCFEQASTRAGPRMRWRVLPAVRPLWLSRCSFSRPNAWATRERSCCSSCRERGCYTGMEHDGVIGPLRGASASAAAARPAAN